MKVEYVKKETGKLHALIILDFQAESYLRYHAESFVKRFGANSYLCITKAIDYFDLAKENGRNLARAFGEVTAKSLVISISSDWLYSPYQSREIVEALTANDIEVARCEIRSNYGHDAFLLEASQMNYTVGNFLSCICSRCHGPGRGHHRAGVKR